jgi:hypothetical protein
MPTLEIAVDARGVTTGLEQANRALDQTAQKADRAEREVEQLGQSAHVAGRDMSAAFAATGGGLAITHGLEGISSGFRSGNSAMAAFAASQALLDLGRFAEDMKSVSAATGTATTIFGTLGQVIRAHPLMTIASVLALAASAMAVFGEDTGEAADEMERLGDAMRKAEASQYVQQVLGLSQDPGVRGRQSAVFQALQRYDLGELQTFDQLARELGITTQDIRQRLAGAPQQVLQAIPRRGLARQLPEAEPSQIYGPQRVPREVAQFIVGQIYAELSREARELATTAPSQLPGRAAGPMGPTLPPGFSQYADPSLLPLMRDRAAAPTPAPLGPTLPPGFQQFADPRLLPTLGNFQGTYTGGQPEQMTGLGVPFGMGFGMQAGMQSMALMQQYGREQVEAAKMAMDELIAQGEQFGQTIGDAFFRVAEGTMTARQAMAELVRQFAQLAAQGVFRQIGGAVGGAFAPTQTQNLANVGGVQPGMTGGTPGG